MVELSDAPLRFLRTSSDFELAKRLQNLILEGTGAHLASSESEQQYDALRRFFIAAPDYHELLPEWIYSATTLRNAQRIVYKKFADRDQRQHQVVQAFRELFRLTGIRSATLEQSIDETLDAAIQSSAWTGIQGRNERLLAAKGMLPAARAAVEDLIASLSVVGHNGGPPIDDIDEAITDLRELHRVLGDLLNSLDDGSFYDGLGQDLASEAVRWTKRAKEKLKSDPAPFAAATLLMTVFSALGFPGTGGFLAACALRITKN